MVGIRCMSLDGGHLQSNKYKGISGQTYQFHKGNATPISNRADVEYFLKANNGEGFKKVNNLKDIVKDNKKALQEVAKELPVKEEPKPEVKEDLKEVPKVEDKKEPVIKHTKTEIVNMSKRAQIKLIRELDSNATIPGVEDGRVKLILKLEGGN